ncbi:phosphotransferase enzyme family protein [Cytobacillus sp. FJAT-54145]|uniref:Phosphotransferase enzyme family protein n=1 Tax=Cytobacillus spartinae TaxID=3299023 RepID=A0ABW6KAV2_9BACI
MEKQSLIKDLSTFYGDDIQSFEWIKEGLQNIVIKCRHQSEMVFLRLMKEERRSLAMIKAELEWLTHLSNSGILVPLPKNSHSGKTIEEITINENVFYTVAYSQVVGEPIDVTNPTLWNEKLFYQWGITLGSIHATPMNREVERPFYTDAKTSYYKTVQFLKDYEDENIRSSLKDIIQEINTVSHTEPSFGLIHNDFHQGNLIVHNGIIGVIDFDDCVYGWFAQDIAVTLYHAFWQATEIGDYDSSFGETFLESFLEGYLQKHKITAEMIEQIPLFLRWRQFFLLALFLKNWPLHQLEDWQAYTLDKLKSRIITGDCYVPLTKKYLKELKQRFATSK